MIIKKHLRSWSLFALLLSGGLACDPLHTKECEWYLEPEPKHAHLVNPGWVSICARNFEINKQKCQFQLRYAEAEKVIGKPITLDSLKYEASQFPRKIASFKFCNPKKKSR